MANARFTIKKKENRKHRSQTKQGKVKAIYSPFHRRDFSIVSQEIKNKDKNGKKYSEYTKQEIIDEFFNDAILMARVQEKFIQSGKYSNIVDYYMIINENPTGSKNSLGRKFDIKPYITRTHHSYNFDEMFRQNIMNSVLAYVQRARIEQIIVDYYGKDVKDKNIVEIQEEYYAVYGFMTHDCPTSQVIKNCIRAYQKTGHVDTAPQPNGLLPLSAADGHYRKFWWEDGIAYLSIAMERGQVTLSFPVPKKNNRFKVGNRIDGGKTDRDGKRITVPNIRFDDKGISFDFTVESPVPQEYDALCNWVCCDQGIVEPVVATFVNGVSYSQPLYMPCGIQSLSRKRARLWEERNCLLRKELLDEAYDNLARYIVHHTERMRVQAKLSNLKREIAARCARYLMRVAVSLDAGVALEQLAWSSGGYNWFHGILTGAIEYSCARAGVPCDRFGAAYTSNRCAFCGSETRVSGRDMICDSGACACHDGGGPRRVNRDVQASRRGCVRVLNKVCVEEVSSLSVLGYERIRFRSVKRAVSVSHGGTGCSPQATTAPKGESLQSLEDQKSPQEDRNSPNSA